MITEHGRPVDLEVLSDCNRVEKHIRILCFSGPLRLILLKCLRDFKLCCVEEFLRAWETRLVWFMSFLYQTIFFWCDYWCVSAYFATELWPCSAWPIITEYPVNFPLKFGHRIMFEIVIVDKPARWFSVSTFFEAVINLQLLCWTCWV